MPPRVPWLRSSPCHTSTIRSLSASCSQLLRSTTPSSITASLPAYRKRRSRRRYSRRRRAAGVRAELRRRARSAAARRPASDPGPGRTPAGNRRCRPRGRAAPRRTGGTGPKIRLTKRNAREDVEEEAEEGEADERGAQQHQVGGDEDRVDVGRRLAAIEGKRGEQDEHRGEDVLEPCRRRADRAAGDQRLGGLGQHLDARHDRVDGRRLGVVEPGGGVADQRHPVLQCGTPRTPRRDRRPSPVSRSAALTWGNRVCCRQLGRTVAERAAGERGAAIVARRSGSEGTAQSPAVTRNGMSRSTPSSSRVTFETALYRVIASPYGSSSASGGSLCGSAAIGNAAGACEARKRRALVVVRMQSRRAEHEATGAALGHGVQDTVAERVHRRGIGKQHVVADRADAGTIELLEQVRVPLAAPRPAAFAARAEVLDRALVDLDHDHAAGRLAARTVATAPRDRRSRSPPRASERSWLQSQPSHAIAPTREQRVERELETERQPRQRPPVTALDPGPLANEPVTERRQACVDPGQHTVHQPARASTIPPAQ